MQEMKEQINKHGYEINVIKQMLSESISAQKETNDSINSLTNTLSIHIEKTSHVEKELSEVKTQLIEQHKTTIEHSKDIAAIKPFMESLRGISRQVIGAILTAAIASALIASAVIKASS